MRRVVPLLIVLCLGFAPAPVYREKPGKDDPARKIVTTASGLKYTEIKVGTGTPTKRGDSLSVHFTCWLAANGAEVGSSVGKAPFDFVLGAGTVVKGFDEGVAGMNAGGKRKLILHPDLAYGATGAGGAIPPNAHLIFEVELLRAVK